MAPLPTTTTISPTVLAIYAAYEAANSQWDSLGISVGEIGNPCDRALYYNLRWASPAEQIEGRKVSIFRTGDMWEERMVADLEAIGVEVWGQQERIRLASGHVRGKIDGRALGIIEAPKTEHLMEFKSSNTKAFAKIKKDGCRKAKPLHFAQCQIGMHALGLSRAGYMVTNKDSDERYFERLEYDADYSIRLIARAERIIFNDEPPARLHEDPNHKMAFECGWCRHRGVCHGQEMPRVTCRSCLHSSPERHGDGAWSCARWSKPISTDEQREGCPNHLFSPSLVPGEQVDCSEENETITYRLPSGELWINGASA